MTTKAEQITSVDTVDLPASSVSGLWFRFKSVVFSQRRNLQNLSALVVFNFLAAGLFFVTQVKIANAIGKERFGLLAYGMALGMYGQTIVRYGMDRTLVRDLIHFPDRFTELVLASLILRGFLLCTVIAALSIWKLFCQPADLTWVVILVIIAYSIKSLDLQAVYDAWHCMARHATYNLIQRGLYFILIWGVAAVSPRQLTLYWIAFGLLTTEISYLILQQRWAFKRMSLQGNCFSLLGAAYSLLKGNVWIWLTALGILSFGTLNQIILKHYCGTTELGGYAASWQLVAAGGLLLGQVGRIGNPATARLTLSNNGKSHRKRFLVKYSVIMGLTALPLVVPALLFPGWILKTVFRPEYISSAPALQVLGVYILVFSQGLVASQYIVSARMEKTYCISVILGSVLSIGLCVVLIPRMGSLGAALALLIAHGIAMGLYWVAVIVHVRKQY